MADHVLIYIVWHLRMVYGVVNDTVKKVLAVHHDVICLQEVYLYCVTFPASEIGSPYHTLVMYPFTMGH